MKGKKQEIQIATHKMGKIPLNRKTKRYFAKLNKQKKRQGVKNANPLRDFANATNRLLDKHKENSTSAGTEETNSAC